MSATVSGPMTAKERARAEFVDRVKELARPLLVYWCFLLVMFGAFSVAALLDDPSTRG